MKRIIESRALQASLQLINAIAYPVIGIGMLAGGYTPSGIVFIMLGPVWGLILGLTLAGDS